MDHLAAGDGNTLSAVHMIQEDLPSLNVWTLLYSCVRSSQYDPKRQLLKKIHLL